MANVDKESIVEAGLEATYTPAAAEQTFTNAPGVFLHVVTGDTGTTVTVAAEVDTTTKPGFGTLSRADIEVTLGTSEEHFIGPFPLTAFGRQPSIAWSATTNVTFAVLQVQ